MKMRQIMLGMLVAMSPTPAWARSASDLQYLLHIGLAVVFWGIVIAIVQDKRGMPFTRGDFLLVLILAIISFVLWALLFYR